MEDSIQKSIMMAISVVLVSSLVSTIGWTFVIGANISSSVQDRAIVYYSEAGLSMMVDSNNLDDIDAVNLYKIMEVNRNIITGYFIQNLDGTYEYDTRSLLNRPIDRFSIVIRGDSSIGFEVSINQVVTPKVGE